MRVGIKPLSNLIDCGTEIKEKHLGKQHLFRRNLGGEWHLFRKSFELPKRVQRCQSNRKINQKNNEKCLKFLITQGFSAFSRWHLFGTLHYSLFTLHFSLTSPTRLFQRRDKREKRKENVAFRYGEKHFN